MTEERFLFAGMCASFALPQNAVDPDKQSSLDNDHLRTQALVKTQTARPSTEIKFRQMRFGRPPLVYLSFDVTLLNDQKSPRWFLLPSNLGSGHAVIGEKGGVDTLEVFSPRGKVTS